MGGSSVSHAYSAVTANPKPSEGGHSQEIVPGLKAPTVGWLISPDLNEVRVQHQTTGCNVRPGPERSEGPPRGVIFHYSLFTIHHSLFAHRGAMGTRVRLGIAVGTQVQERRSHSG